MKWKKIQSFKYFFFSFVLVASLILQPISSIGLLASTTSGSENLFEYTENYVRDNFNALCRYVVKQNAIISDAIIGTWDNFTSWLDSSGNGDIWEQYPHSPIRVQNGVENVEIPNQVLNVLNQYIINQIQQNPLGYTECYINSYNFIDSTQFWTYAQYASIKQFIKNQDGYVFIKKNAGYVDLRGGGYICVMPRTIGVSFVGNTNYGTFTSVQPSINWQVANVGSFSSNSEIKWYSFDGNGQITQGSYSGYFGQSTANTSTFTDNNRNTVYTSKDKNELVFVFKTLNSLKNYNSGSPQGYYLTSDGLSNNMSNWTVGSGTINTGTLSSTNSTYNSVVNNVQSGWSAEEVLQLVDKIISQNNSNGSGSGDSSSDNPFDFLGKIGEIIGNLVNGIGNLIVNILDGISKAFLGEDGNGGIIGLVSNVLTSLTTLISEDFANFINGIFSFMPEELRIVLIAGFTISVFLGVLKMIRK